MRDIFIRGDGVAAYCCAYLLTRAGFRVTGERADRPRLPAVLLSENALALIRDVFGQSDLFRNLPRIERRVVAWGPNARALVLDHSAVVVSEDLLLESLRPKVPLDEKPEQRGCDWTILASQPLPPVTIAHRFGSRHGWVAPVRVKSNSDPAACWIESVEKGWLFLIPGMDGSGTLLSVGAASAELLGDSRLIVDQIVETGAPEFELPVYPRIVSPLCGPGWFACGSAAMAFDPICGDGTAHAIREAVLASAVIQALAKREPCEEVLAYYEARLTGGFKRHLSLCREYYGSGGNGPWWESELEWARRGVDWCESKPGAAKAFLYGLDGFELHQVRRF